MVKEICQDCLYKEINEERGSGGYCYMFNECPTGICFKFHQVSKIYVAVPKAENDLTIEELRDDTDHFRHAQDLVD